VVVEVGCSSIPLSLDCCDSSDGVFKAGCDCVFDRVDDFNPVVMCCGTMEGICSILQSWYKAQKKVFIETVSIPGYILGVIC